MQSIIINIITINTFFFRFVFLFSFFNKIQQTKIELNKIRKTQKHVTSKERGKNKKIREGNK